MRERHGAGKLPDFLDSLAAPKALDGLPSLQPLWDEVTAQYKQNLYQALVNAREEKLATQYSPAIRDEIIKSLVAAIKKLCADKSTADPSHQPSFEAEGMATFSLFTKSITHWEQLAREQALTQMHKQQEKKDTTERQTLEQANVSDILLRLTTDTNTSVDLWPATTRPQVPAIPTEGHPYQRQGQHGRGIQGEPQGQPQRGLKGQGSRKRKRNVTTLQSSPLLTVHNHTTKPKNRRLSKAQKNRIKVRNDITDDLKAELAELKLMKANLREIGVAQKLVHNLTGKIIPQGALNCLALGTKFITVPKSDPSILPLGMKLFRKTVRLRHIFQDDGNNEMPKYWLPSSWNPPYLDQRKDIEATLDALQHSIKPYTSPVRSNINKRDIQQYNKLLHDDNTLVILADKNLGYAVVTKAWYLERCYDHLNTPSYCKVTDTYKNGVQGKSTVDYLVDSLSDLIMEYQDQLGPDEIKWILQKPKDEWQPMRFYITAKVHKKPVKGRPIVPSMTWLTFHLSQWLANQLNPLLSNTEWVLKDSYDLLASFKLMNETDLPHTVRIASADVDALYPSMDIKTGLQLVRNFIEELDWQTRQMREFLIKAMEFVLTNGYIVFENDIYQQTNGAAMGSPMIPPYANIFMYQLEKNTVHKYKNSGTLLLFKRFIDDVIIITKDSNITELQNELNNLDPSIKLTWSPPAKHCNFLDVIVSIKNNKIHTSVFQKQLNTYAYLPFHSYHTTAQKRGFIKGEAIRYARICTSEVDFKLMVKLFTLRLQRRGYPLSFIQRSLGQVQHKDRHNYTVTSNKNNKKVIPLLFKTEYNPIVSHHNVRTALNQFSANIMKLANVHPSISQKVTICYKMPPKLHVLSLKARKRKGL
jgi:ribosomal protein L15